MKPRNIYLSEKQWSKVKKIAGRTGISVSELIRRMVDRIIEEDEEKRFRRRISLEKHQR
jgi:cytidylate kinase